MLRTLRLPQRTTATPSWLAHHQYLLTSMLVSAAHVSAKSPAVTQAFYATTGPSFTRRGFTLTQQSATLWCQSRTTATTTPTPTPSLLAQRLQQHMKAAAGVADELLPDLQSIEERLADIKSPSAADREAAAELIHDWHVLAAMITIGQENDTVLSHKSRFFMMRVVFRINKRRASGRTDTYESLSNELVQQRKNSEIYKIFDEFFGPSPVPFGRSIYDVISDLAHKKQRVFTQPCRFEERGYEFLSFSRKFGTRSEVLFLGPSAAQAAARLHSPPGGLRRLQCQWITDFVLGSQTDVFVGTKRSGRTLAALCAATESCLGCTIGHPGRKNGGIYVTATDLFGETDAPFDSTQVRERNDWVTNRVVDKVKQWLFEMIGMPRGYYFARAASTTRGESHQLVLIIDDLDNRHRQILLGLRAASYPISDALNNILGGDDGIVVRIIAVCTDSADVYSVTGPSVDTRVLQIRFNDYKPLEFWTQIAEALAREDRRWIHLPAATQHFPQAALSMLEQTGFAVQFCSALQEIVTSFDHRRDHSGRVVLPSVEEAIPFSLDMLVSCAPIVCAMALRRECQVNGLRHTTNPLAVVLEALSLSVNARSTLPEQTRLLFVEKFGIIEDDLTIAREYCCDGYTMTCRAYTAKIAETSTAEQRQQYEEQKQPWPVLRLGAFFVVRSAGGQLLSWRANLPRFRIPASIAAIALTDFGRNFDAAGSAVAGSNLEQDVFSAVALYARMPSLDPSKGDIVEATTHLRRIVDGLGVRRNVIRGKTPFHILDVAVEERDSNKIGFDDEEELDDEEHSARLRAAQYAEFYKSLRRGLKEGDAFVLWNPASSSSSSSSSPSTESAERVAHVIVIAPRRFIMIDCVDLTSSSNTNHDASAALSDGSIIKKWKKRATTSSSSSTTRKLIDVCREHKDDKVIVDRVLVWTAFRNVAAAKSDPMHPTPPPPIPSSASTKRATTTRYHIVDATLREQHEGGCAGPSLASRPLFPVPQRFKWPPPEVVYYHCCAHKRTTPSIIDRVECPAVVFGKKHET